MSFAQVMYILWKRMGVISITFFSTLLAAVLFVLIVPPRYEGVASATLDSGALDPVNNTQMVSGSSSSVLLVQGNLVGLAKSNQVALEVVKRLSLAADPTTIADYNSSKAKGVVDVSQWVANQLLDNVDAKFAQQSNVLNITYKSRDPVQSAALANAFLGAFIDAAITMRSGYAQQSANWFSPQLENLRGELAKAKKTLADFQINNNFVGPTNVADTENDQLTAVTADLSKTKAELVSLKSQLATSATATAESNEAQMVDQQSLTTLRNNLSVINAEITKFQREIGINNPKLQERLSTKRALLSQINELIANHHKKLAERIEALQAKALALEKARAEQIKKMIDVQNKREQFASLTHEVEARQLELEKASLAASQARLQGQYSFSNISVLDKATPPVDPAFPKPIIVAAASIILGLFLGLVLALFAEVFDRRIRSAADLEFVTGSPVLVTL